MSITAISTAITALAFYFASAKIHQVWIKNKKRNKSLNYFYLFLFYFGTTQVFFSLATGAIGYYATNIWFWAIAHVFMFLALISFVRFIANIQAYKKEKIVVNLAIVYSIIGIIVVFYNAQFVNAYLALNGVYIMKVPDMAGAVIGIINAIIFIPSIIIFFLEGKKAQDKKVKTKSYVLSFGILLFFLGGPMHNFVTTPTLTFIVDFLIVAGASTMALAIYFNEILDRDNNSSN